MIRNVRTNTRRLGRMLKRSKPSQIDFLLTEAQFRAELDREVFRSDRRDDNREFGLIRLKADFGESMVAFCRSAVFEHLLGYLDVSDTLGHWEDGLAILIPESRSYRTMTLANEIVELLEASLGSVSAQVSTYPNDDQFVSMSHEVRRMVKKAAEDCSDDQRQDFQHDGVPEPMSRLYFDPSGQGDAASALAVAERPQVSVERKRRSQTESNPRVVQQSFSFVQPLVTPWWKRGIDILGSSLGLVLLSPVLVIAAIAIRATSKGPIFFYQRREGKGGREFAILKFRTMVINAEELQARLRDQSEQDGPAFKLTNDPRVTSAGRYLRKSCIDELPQLWNVLKGDMSLVGPRPLPVDESQACTTWQRARLKVLPGLTCTWQAYGGRDIKFAQWMQMDLDYIQRRGFWFDLKLIFATAVKAVLHRGSV